MNFAGYFIGIIRNNKPHRTLKSKRKYRRYGSYGDSHKSNSINHTIREVNHLSPEEINRLMYSFQKQTVIARRWKRFCLLVVLIIGLIVLFNFASRLMA